MINMKVDSEETRNAKRAENRKSRGIPKNIRQVGDIPQGDRIYIEDYVVTYLNQLAHPANRIAKGAVLLGEWSHEGRKDILYISGAVEADNLSFDMKEITFSSETWTSIHQKIEDNFPGEQVVGWFLSRLGYSVALEKEMEECHRENFKGDKTVLYLMDALEQEDAFYLFNQTQVTQLPGYYIYYERNTPMQEYLIEHHAQYNTRPEEDRMAYKDSQVLHSYHEIMAGRRARKEQKQVTRLLYITSAMLTLVFLALGITVFNNYDRIKRIQSALEFLSGETKTAKEYAIADSDSATDPADSADTNASDTNSAENDSAAEHTNALGGAIGAETADAEADTGNGAAIANAKETANAGAAIANAEETPDAGADTANASEGDNKASETATSVNNSQTDALVNAKAAQTDPSNTADAAAGQSVSATDNVGQGDAAESQSAVSAHRNNTGEVLQATSSNVANYYTVQAGDTLLSICQKVYHSDAYVDLVKQANELENSDVIYPGQQIVLPSID